MRRNRILLALSAVIILPGLAALGAFTGATLPEWTEWAGSPLREARAEAGELGRQVAAQQALIEQLRAQTNDLQQRLGERDQALDERDRTIAHLEVALGEHGPLSEKYAEIASQYGVLQVAYQELQDELSHLVRIRTPELPGDVLLFDRSVKGVKYTGAVCSGSMEPNISCNDLLLLYEPNVTDLRVGDIIYFRRQSSDCSGPMENRYMLHRITRVTAGTEGLRFQTKGDALSGPDRCAVPAGDVLYKLLTNVRNARIQN